MLNNADDVIYRSHVNSINNYNTIQYKNDFCSAVIEGAEALVGRL